MNPMFYFLLAFTLVLAATAGEPVLDSDGDIIFDGSYYVLPAKAHATGGGLNLSPAGDDQCPLNVGQEYSGSNKGIPVKFSNWKSKVGFVPESEPLNIEMDVKATICDQSTYWWARGEGGLYNDVLLIEAGPKPDAGEDSVNAFFQIKKNEDFGGYNIAFCSVDNGCENVEVFMDGDGVKRLVVGEVDSPLTVRFVKFSEAETSSKTMSII